MGEGGEVEKNRLGAMRHEKAQMGFLGPEWALGIEVREEEKGKEKRERIGCLLNI